MSKINLKNLLKKNIDSRNIVTSLAEQLKARIIIVDDAERILYSNTDKPFQTGYPVIFENEILGWVRGDEPGELIAKILMHLLDKESESKRLGTEVLNLYQEINLIFNFSDKLAQTIGAKPIAEITLIEGAHVNNSKSGVVVLWDEVKSRLEVVASLGKEFFDETKINSELTLLQNIILNGQSEILNNLAVLKQAGIILPEINSLVYSALKVKHRIMGAIILADDNAEKYNANSLKLLTTLALQSSSAIESSLLYEKSIREAQEREAAMRKIFDATGKFVPHEFLKSLGHQLITDVKLGDQVEKIVTVLFTDIRNYTSLSELLTPEETFGFISSFNANMGPIIRKNHGFINQYLGDSIMAIFPGNAVDALAAAIEMQKEIEILNRINEENNKPGIQIGVGMHTGSLIMGITGDLDRLDACTISDTVNTASRVESLTKHYKAAILLSDATLNQIEKTNDFHLRNLGLVQLKGKHSSIHIYECFNCANETELQKKLGTLSLFNEGVSFYQEKKFVNACNSFKKVMLLNDTDHTAKFFYDHIHQILKSGAQKYKSGTVEMEEK